MSDFFPVFKHAAEPREGHGDIEGSGGGEAAEDAAPAAVMRHGPLHMHQQSPQSTTIVSRERTRQHSLSFKR